MIKKLTLFLLVALLPMMAQAQTLVTPPADAEVEDWTISFVYHYNDNAGEQTENISETMGVVFDGTDVYFNLPNPITGNAWVKGSLTSSTAVFLRSQFIGSNNGYTGYFDGLADGGLCDVVFYYNSEQGIFSTDYYVLINSSTTANSPWCYYTDVVVTKGAVNPDSSLTPPESVEQEDWILTGRNTNPSNEAQYEELNEVVKVAISDGNIWIQGLCGYVPSAWLKGTISGAKATFPKRQLMGSGYGSPDLYMIGYNGAETDIVFDYDAEKGTLTAQAYILAVSADDVAYLQLTNVYLYKKGEDTPDPTEQLVTPPAGLTTQEYQFKATSIEYDMDGSVAAMTPVTWNVRVGFSGQDVYIQGLTQHLPDAWVKGTKNDDAYRFDAGQFYGKTKLGQKFYFGSLIFNSLASMDMAWNSSTFTFSGGSFYLILNSQPAVSAPYEVYAGVTITRIPNVAAIPANPQVVEYQPYNTDAQYGYVCFKIPTQDNEGNGILMDKLGYNVFTEIGGTVSQMTFEAPLYEGVTSPMTTVPYMFEDGYDFYRGGSFVALYDPDNTFDKIGVQSVYDGGGVRNLSDVVWYTINQSTDGIDAPVSDDVVSEYCTDLMGRRVSSSYKGIVIVTRVMADGSHHSTKVVRR